MILSPVEKDALVFLAIWHALCIFLRYEHHRTGF